MHGFYKNALNNADVAAYMHTHGAKTHQRAGRVWWRSELNITECMRNTRKVAFAPQSTSFYTGGWASRSPPSTRGLPDTVRLMMFLKVSACFGVSARKACMNIHAVTALVLHLNGNLHATQTRSLGERVIYDLSSNNSPRIKSFFISFWLLEIFVPSLDHIK